MKLTGFLESLVVDSTAVGRRLSRWFVGDRHVGLSPDMPGFSNQRRLCRWEGVGLARGAWKMLVSLKSVTMALHLLTVFLSQPSSWWVERTGIRLIVNVAELVGSA
jgi:hypothetical protein